MDDDRPRLPTCPDCGGLLHPIRTERITSAEVASDDEETQVVVCQCLMTEPGRDCPLCGERMRLVERTVVDRTPGTSEEKSTHFFEWVCPECDYFEEKEEGGGTE